MKSRGTKASRHHPQPPKRKGWQEKGDRWGRGGGRERRHTVGREVQQPPWPSHPLQEGPGLPHSAFVLLLKFQLCAQPSWPSASHVPAPGWAAGSGARGRHMDEKPGSAEQRAGHRAQGHRGWWTQPSPALSTAWGPPTQPAYIPRECLWVRFGAGQQGDLGSHMVWQAQAEAICLDHNKSLGLLAEHRGLVGRQDVYWSGHRLWVQMPASEHQRGDLKAGYVSL